MLQDSVIIMKDFEVSTPLIEMVLFKVVEDMAVVALCTVTPLENSTIVYWTSFAVPSTPR